MFDPVTVTSKNAHPIPAQINQLTTFGLLIPWIVLTRYVIPAIEVKHCATIPRLMVMLMIVPSGDHPWISMNSVTEIQFLNRVITWKISDTYYYINIYLNIVNIYYLLKIMRDFLFFSSFSILCWSELELGNSKCSPQLSDVCARLDSFGSDTLLTGKQWFDSLSKSILESNR